ncbi:MAG: complement resistance protein TraT [Cellvibrionaceae bacterium]|nr:complement resistance protein TraT [Cellvibrionaceae bacterium]
MQAFVLNLEKASETAAKLALSQGYLGGSMIAGAAVDHNNRFRGAGVGGLAAGAADFVASSVVKDVYYMLVVDLQVSEKNGDRSPSVSDPHRNNGK